MLRSPSWSPSPATIFRMILRMICKSIADQKTKRVNSTNGGSHLSGPGLRQIGDNIDFFRSRERADRLADLEDELLSERGFVVNVVLEFSASDVNHFAGLHV